MGEDEEFHIPETTEFTVENLHTLESGFDWDSETEVGTDVLAWASTLSLPYGIEGVDHDIDHYVDPHAGEAIA